MKNQNTSHKLKILLLTAFCWLFLWQCNNNETPSPTTSKNDSKNPYVITIDDAVKVALKFNFSSKDSAVSSAKKGARITTTEEFDKRETVNDENNTALFHVLNSSKGGFIIVSADFRAIPILAYADKGNFDTKNAPTINGLSLWFKQAKDQIKQIKADNKDADPKIVKVWNDYLGGKLNLPKGGRTTTNTSCEEWYTVGQYMCHNSTATYGPFLQTNWGQNNIENYYSPGPDGGNCNCGHNPAGCGPIAMSQVYNFYNPISSAPSYTYYCNPANSADYQVATLVRNCGIYANSTYHFWGSCNTLTYPWDISGGLSGIGMSNGGSTASYPNAGTLNSELTGNHPVIFYGYDTIDQWHIWVCDGLDTHYYSEYDCDIHNCVTWEYAYWHMNWGWHGTSNGWFTYGNLNSGSGNFTGATHFIYNIRP